MVPFIYKVCELMPFTKTILTQHASMSMVVDLGLSLIRVLPTIHAFAIMLFCTMYFPTFLMCSAQSAWQDVVDMPALALAGSRVDAQQGSG